MTVCFRFLHAASGFSAPFALIARREFEIPTPGEFRRNWSERFRLYVKRDANTVDAGFSRFSRDVSKIAPKDTAVFNIFFKILRGTKNVDSLEQKVTAALYGTRTENKPLKLV